MDFSVLEDMAAVFKNQNNKTKKKMHIKGVMLTSYLF
jgi:hypothetical protein